MKPWYKAFFGVMALALIGVTMAYFAGWFHSNVAVSDKPVVHLAGDIVRLKLEPVPEVVVVPGTVQATDETIIGARILAAVSQVHVRSGARVTKGDLLLELDDATPRTILKQR